MRPPNAPSKFQTGWAPVVGDATGAGCQFGPATAKPSARRSKKGSSNLSAQTRTQARKKASKDPDKPRRPPSAFFVFLAEFTEEYRRIHPLDWSNRVISKACGDKWKTMSEQDKAVYVEKAQHLKAEYDRLMAEYNKRLEEEKDKPKVVTIPDSEYDDDDDDDDDGGGDSGGGGGGVGGGDGSGGGGGGAAAAAAADLSQSPACVGIPRAPIDANKPRWLASTFYGFMLEFSEDYQASHPTNWTMAAVAKAGIDKWRAMSEQEKDLYEEKAEHKKSEYNRLVAEYNKRKEEEKAKANAVARPDTGSNDDDWLV